MYKQIVSILAAAAVLPLGLAHPVGLENRQAPGPLSAADESVLQLALFLEHLEYNLYTGGYEAFTEAEYEAAGFEAGFRDNVAVIASQEATHAATITSILEENSVTPIPNCTYSFPYSDPTSFVDLSNMVTTVGIGAYLGGALSLTDNPNLLTAASSILTTEARHDSYLRAGVGGSPFPTPFDTSLTAVWAYNLALMFVTSCPQYLPLIELPKLKLASPMPPADLQPPTPAGTTLTFNWDPSTFFVSVDPSAPLYIAMINQNYPVVYEEVTSCGTGCGTVPVPAAPVGGVAFAVLTTFSGGLNSTELTSFGTLAGPAEVVLS